MRKTSRKHLIKPLFILVVFFCMAIWYYMIVLVPIIKTFCTAKINSLTEQALNLAVSNVINTTVNYDSIMCISYNQNGEITWKSIGTATITASSTTSATNAGTYNVVIKLNDTVELSTGKYVVIPPYAKKPNIYFKSLDNSNILSISGNKLKANKEGTAVVGDFYFWAYLDYSDLEYSGEKLFEFSNNVSVGIQFNLYTQILNIKRI